MIPDENKLVFFSKVMRALMPDSGHIYLIIKVFVVTVYLVDVVFPHGIDCQSIIYIDAHAINKKHARVN